MSKLLFVHITLTILVHFIFIFLKWTNVVEFLLTILLFNTLNVWHYVSRATSIQSMETFPLIFPAVLSLQCRCDSEEHSERQHCRSRWAHPHRRHHPVCEFHLKHNRWLFFCSPLYCISWRQIPCCLRYSLSWILTISASPNLHSLQLLVVQYMPIRVLFFFLADEVEFFRPSLYHHVLI